MRARRNNTQRPITRWLATMVMTVVAMIAWGVADAMAAPAATQPASVNLSQWTSSRITGILDQVESDGDFTKAIDTAMRTWNVVAAWSEDRDVTALADAAMTTRMLHKISALPVADRPAALKLMRDNPDLARAVIFLLNDRDDAPKNVFAVLRQLETKAPGKLNTLATLAAAVAVVHDGPPMQWQLNENKVQAPPAEDIFSYYQRNESKMAFGLRQVPAELLIYVVDVVATIPELEWALGQHARAVNFGQLYSSIRYDLDHLRRGTPKKVSLNGYNLPNIRKYGGVCVDQAYFAVEVGKALGIPTVLASGANASVAHAWVGYLAVKGKAAGWDFSVGRYSEYREVGGSVLHPQTRRRLPDSFVAVQAEMIGSTPADRHASHGLSWTALRWLQLDKQERPASPPPAPADVTGLRKEPRAAGLPTVLALLESSLKLNAANVEAWLTVRDMAQEGQLTLDDKKRWGGFIQTLCGERYPDFALDVLIPMVRTVKDPKEQNTFWNAAFKAFEARPDLAARLRMEQAAMWTAAGDTPSAGRCYEDVIHRYANAGPFVLDALDQATKLLAASSAPEKALDLYAKTWKSIKKPGDSIAPEFATQHNWYRVGRMYQHKLIQFNQTQAADKVRKDLDEYLGAPRT